jgi:quercetin dioxygenase-like cupin family protein
MRYALILCVATALGPAQQPARQTHNVAVDNQHVRVVRAMNTPGQKSRPHKHDVNRVMVHLDRGTMRLAYDTGKVDDVVFKPGDVRWDPAGGIHTSENIGGTTYHIVEIELKQPGSATPTRWPKLDPLAVDGRHHKVEFENDQVRVLRQRVAPGDRSTTHEHLLPRVVVTSTKQGTEVHWADRETHSEPAGVDAVIVEIKAGGPPSAR